jgi:hypothetical protein
MPSNSNRGVVYLKPGRVEVQNIDFPTFRNPAGKTIDHGVILKVVTTKNRQCVQRRRCPSSPHQHQSTASTLVNAYCVAGEFG